MNHYILDGNGQPQLAESLEAWGAWYSPEKCRILYDRVGISFIWTTFNPVPTDPENPKFWQTQVQGGPLDTLRDVIGGSREQGEAQHRAVVERVQKETEK